VGAVGAIATFCIVILKVSAMSYLLINSEFLGILATLYLSRLMIVGTIYKSDFHNQSKFIYSMKNQLDKRSMTILTLISLIILTILDHILLIPIALIGAIILKNWLLKKIGFLNGDGLGFMIEINELILLNIVILS
jgi:adenosylcobinamide-GDP ribazoletransferase